MASTQIAMRCYHCGEWAWKPKHRWASCPCGKLIVYSSGIISGYYTEFWNEDKNIHHIYKIPRGN